MYTISVDPNKVQEVLKQYILADGLDFTVDLEKSKGCYLHDSTNNRDILDFFTFFATSPVGHNHPKMLNDEEFKKNLLIAAISNPSNSDFYTTQYATFVKTFARIAMPKPFKYSFFIAGGALAVENALKVAMDWKVQKNFKKGYKEEKGHQVIHFREAFHGRSGYTLSLTNTDPNKTNYFTKFDWPRIDNPTITFPLNDANVAGVIKKEEKAVEQIKQALVNRKDDICAILIEPIQREGGGNYFRKEFFLELRKIADENEVLLIFDEVQNGVGLTGKFWAYQHFDVVPDILAFGKKMQVCGIISTNRVDDIENNCFHASSRINSTWGGNLVDMVRATKYLEIIEEDNLVENSARQGKYILNKLFELKKQFPLSNIRGLGLQCAFDLPTEADRDALIKSALENNLLLLSCGERSIRFRTPLIISEKEIDEGISIMEKTFQKMFSKY